MVSLQIYTQEKYILKKYTCLDEASYSSSQPVWAFSKDETFLYLLFNSDRGISLNDSEEPWLKYNKTEIPNKA